MKEVEVKILEVDKSEVEGKLRHLGAQKVFDGEVEAVFFDFADRRIAKAKNVVRLRRENDVIVLTAKVLLGEKNMKVAKEYEVTVSDLESMKWILEFLGLFPTEEMKKRRTSYRLDDVKFELDSYEEPYSYIPTFLEIEAKDEAVIYDQAKLLGFTTSDCLPWSTADLVNYYAKRSP
jgi:adenylate cyclase class 2